MFNIEIKGSTFLCRMFFSSWWWVLQETVLSVLTVKSLLKTHLLWPDMLSLADVSLSRHLPHGEDQEGRRKYLRSLTLLSSDRIRSWRISSLPLHVTLPSMIFIFNIQPFNQMLADTNWVRSWELWQSTASRYCLSLEFPRKFPVQLWELRKSWSGY